VSSRVRTEISPARIPSGRGRDSPWRAGGRWAAPLRARLVLLIALLLCALAVPALILLPERAELFSRRWVESRSVGIARLLSSAAGAALDFDDRVAAMTLLEQLGATPGAVWGIVLRHDGSPLATWRDPPPDARAPGASREQVRYGEGRITVQVPVEGRLSKGGTLAVAFDLTELQGRVAEARRLVVTGALATLLAGILGAFLIGTFLARPLRRITAVAERIASGEAPAAGDLALQTRRHDESGALARAFEEMLERLGEKQAALGRTNSELAEKLAELKRTQEQLVTADRRISVGRLAAGVAHEINNPLGYVSSNLRYVAKSLPVIAAALESEEDGRRARAAGRVAELRSAVDQAAEGTERIRQITKGLKGFAREDDGCLRVLAVQDPLEAAIAMAKHEITQRARIVREYGPVPPVEGSEVRLSQVLLNLLINAAHAIPEGDSEKQSVTIATRTTAQGWAAVEVKDSGCGIAPENLGRLFEAFFTTKPAGVGTGLGLSICDGIVKAMGGRIEVESEVGRGSTFRVLLPPAPARAGAAVAAAPAPAPVRPGSGSLLVVDDELALARALARELEPEFRVVTAGSAAEALTLVAGERFDHVLCDLMMPDMNGAAFHAELSRRLPDVAEKVIFMSGGAFTPATEQFLSTWKGGFLPKPVDLDHLRRIVHAKC
jgi:signal transduction histidine kinase/CheY-like chemotaxis protein